MPHGREECSSPRMPRSESPRRSVPLEIVEAIYWYGHEERAPGQAARVTLDPEAIRLASEDMPSLRGKLECYRDTDLVLSNDQQIITVARRNTRFFY